MGRKCKEMLSQKCRVVKTTFKILSVTYKHLILLKVEPTLKLKSDLQEKNELEDKTQQCIFSHKHCNKNSWHWIGGLIASSWFTILAKWYLSLHIFSKQPASHSVRFISWARKPCLWDWKCWFQNSSSERHGLSLLSAANQASSLAF